MTTEPVESTLVIVAIGAFNPTIVNPDWLVRKGALGENEASKAKVEVIHRDLTHFSLEWCAIRVTPERFEVKCDALAYFEPARDLFTSIFKALRETPVKHLGFNLLSTFDLGDTKKFEEFGKFLAPLNIWSEVVENPKLRNIEVLESPRRDKRSGYKHIAIESTSSSNVKYGVIFNINDHFNLANVNEMFEIFEHNWALSFENATKLHESIWKQFLSM